MHPTNLLCTAVVVTISGVACPALAQDLIPRDVLFGNPDRIAPIISPDGARLAFGAPHNGVVNVWVQTIGQHDAKPLTESSDRPITNFFWAQNSEQVLYVRDSGGDEDFHVYAVDLATGESRDLTPFDSIQARVTGTSRDFPDEILVSINNRVPQLHDVHRVNTHSGESTLLFENKEGWVGLIADNAYAVRSAMRFTPDGGLELFLRPDAAAEWTPFTKWDQQDARASSPMGFSIDGKTLYMMDSAGVNTAGLYSVDLSAAAPARTLIASSDKADISNAVIDPLTGHPQAAAAWEYAHEEWTILDPAIQPDWDYLTTVEDGDFSIVSRDNADVTWTVSYVVDDGPVRYYLYDRAARKASFLFTNRPALERYTLAKMNPVVIPSRDGLDLVSYLTLPAHVLAHEAVDLPMVLFVHGGPWARDTWGYNGAHQWLSNRGYAVLSVNFRGSTGFGKDFINAGNREWAGKMHDDLIDAVNWAVEESIADPDRIAIMGGSYGGYATLVGLTFTPDVFAAGVDIVGPSHVGTLLASIPPYWEPLKVMFESRMGAASETAFLDSISPLTKVDAITRPLLIGQGADDPRVKQAESEQIVKAMQERNIPVTYVLFPDEGHGFARPVNNMAFFAITEAFLAEHLGGRYEPIDDDVTNSSAQVKAGAELVTGLGN